MIGILGLALWGLAAGGCGDVVVKSGEDVAADATLDVPDAKAPCVSDLDCATGLACRVGSCDEATGTCNVTTAPETCFIEGVCFTRDQQEPGDRCSVCDPDLSKITFVNRVCEAGETCNPDNGQCEIGDLAGFGEPCASDAACESGLCLEGPEGKVCSRTCQASCPAGYACVAPDGGGDSVCVSRHLDLCRPCQADAECASDGASPLARCVARAHGAGSFCGLDCQADGDCPGGYVCEAADGETKQCQPEAGVCACSPRAVAAAAETGCGLGACAGMRWCGDDGLTECDGPAPTGEVCNGQDDDCDGETDEDFAQGGVLVHDEHCGACGVPCQIQDGVAACALVDGAAVCQLLGCEPGFEESAPGVCTAIDPTECKADGDCPAPAGPCAQVACVDGTCAYGAAPNGTACDDGDPCTSGDACQAGVCAGAGACECVADGDCALPAGLDAGCAAVTCVGGTCQVQLGGEGSACDDGEACTQGDACSAGACVPGAWVCACSQDSDCPTPAGQVAACTTAACVDGACVYGVQAGVCDDGDPCTTGDACSQGACAGVAVDCSELDGPCHEGTCTAGGCVAVPVDQACDDGDPCTIGDACAAGVCAGAALDCSALDGPCQIGLCTGGLCAVEEVACELTDVVVQTPSAALSVAPASGALGLRASVGHAGPVGAAKGSGGLWIRFGFHGATASP